MTVFHLRRTTARRSRRARDLRPLRTEPTPASALIEGFDSSNRRPAVRR
jgi:hypothetical protein